VPGITISAHKARQFIAMVEINAVLRHLYLSVMEPMTGRTNRAGIVNNVNIKPTTTDEYPRCIDIVVKNGNIGAAPE